MTRRYLSQRAVLVLAIASAIVTANAYYVHPIIGLLAEDFGVDEALVGAVPAFNQIALALGIFLLLPLGDRISNRRLAMVCLSAQVVALAIMVLADNFWLFVAGSTLLGFFTVTPYLLPAYTSKRVEPTRLGHATAMLTTGVIAGILLSRTGSGVVAEFLGWRSVYWIALALMAGSALVLPLLLEEREPSQKPAELPSYPRLIGSLWSLARAYPQVVISGGIQALSFSIFLTLWLGVGLHLTSDEMGYGTDMVGYLSALSALNLLTTPRLGKLADRLGARRTRALMAAGQMVGVTSLFVAGSSYWWLIFPTAINSIVGPMIDITGRMTCLDQPGEIRTRLMALYITIMFLGGGLGSWTGTIAYDFAGWNGICIAALGLSALVLALSVWQARTGGTHNGAG